MEAPTSEKACLPCWAPKAMLNCMILSDLAVQHQFGSPAGRVSLLAAHSAVRDKPGSMALFEFHATAA